MVYCLQELSTERVLGILSENFWLESCAAASGKREIRNPSSELSLPLFSAFINFIAVFIK